MILASALGFLLAAIPLEGVVGDDVSARSYFDANNVHVGDPMVLTIDFIGSAEFSDLHPPALSKSVDRRTWKIDDESAKTETYMDARRLVYRVRPLKAGLLEFPSLEFTYEGSNGRGEVKVLTSPIPVHARPGVQAVLAGLDDWASESMPMPDGIVIDLGGRELTDDESFAWRKACNNPTSEAFGQFDFPEAKMNEAACLVVEGKWAMALRVYNALEWRIGQTPAVERGITAALARKHGDPALELPAWRQVGRPWLRHAWPGRLALAAAALALFCAVMWLSGRIVRAMACLALAAMLAAPCQARADASLFDEIDKMMRRQQERMDRLFNSMPMGGGSSLTINGMRQEPVEVKARASLSKDAVSVGDSFEYLLSLECPKNYTISDVQIDVSQKFGLALRGPVENLADADSTNPSNVVHRLSVPVRYDVPFTGDVEFTINGMIEGARTTGSPNRRMTFRFSQNFSAKTNPVKLSIRPLKTDGQPPDFAGAIGSKFLLRRSVDRNSVETNDVVTVRSTLEYSGYVPRGAIPDEMARQEGDAVRASVITWQRYFVADGKNDIPAEDICYYDVGTRKYSRVTAPAIPLSYRSVAASSESAVAVDVAAREKSENEALKALSLHFAPREDSPVVASVVLPEDAQVVETERLRGWRRVEACGHAGWMREEDSGIMQRSRSYSYRSRSDLPV